MSQLWTCGTFSIEGATHHLLVYLPEAVSREGINPTPSRLRGTNATQARSSALNPGRTVQARSQLRRARLGNQLRGNIHQARRAIFLSPLFSLPTPSFVLAQISPCDVEEEVSVPLDSRIRTEPFLEQSLHTPSNSEINGIRRPINWYLT